MPGTVALVINFGGSLQAVPNSLTIDLQRHPFSLFHLSSLLCCYMMPCLSMIHVAVCCLMYMHKCIFVEKEQFRTKFAVGKIWQVPQVLKRKVVKSRKLFSSKNKFLNVKERGLGTCLCKIEVQLSLGLRKILE